MHEFAIDVDKPSSSFNIISPGVENNSDKSLNDLIQHKIKERKRFFGIEISPASNGDDLDYNKFTSSPLFTAVTWLFDHNLKYDSLSSAPAVHLGKSVQKCSPVLMHLTCYKLQPAILRELIDIGFKNIMALKGDPYEQCENQPWTYAIDLVKAIRELSADATVAVSGYPEVHRLATSRADDLKWLKLKVDAGANFIITNTCFSYENLMEFVQSCRAIGITVPIIPGVYVPSSYVELHKMCSICKVEVPHSQMVMYERYKNDSQRFVTYAIENTVNLLTQIFNNDEHPIYGVQFFTLNKYKHIYEVVEKCDFANK
ncbi:methylenetetrahydrofolate reductase [Contarinia nasturtii]|uniref:methylenetetrahydrofolate reductase n=1 Tax=Contarinia nasturtii TaxID=265458 RepID=UPI0012D3BDB5|nr:methylenetetrahydrofolate reductase [Contarinia nasturtii]